MRRLLSGCIMLLAALSLSSAAFSKSRFGSKLCEEPEYECYTTQRGDTWKKLFPDEQEREIVKRINRVNINVPRGTVIAIPRSLTDNILDYSPFPIEGEIMGTRYILVSISKLAFGAYDEMGQLQYWGPISTGNPNIRRGTRTPTGTFAIYRKGSSGCKSSKFPIGRGGAPMPYCMFFHRGFAMHGSNQVPGYNASHGCIRMYTEDAKWINTTFTDGYYKVPVIVTN